MEGPGSVAVPLCLSPPGTQGIRFWASGCPENGRHVNSTRQLRLVRIVAYKDTVPDVGYQVVNRK
jgi:hypothetical protein